MSKLALRIFASFFTALVVTALGIVAVTSWAISERKKSAEAELLAAAEQAANALADGGTSSLTDWAKTRAIDPTVTLEILVIDETGRELLGRLDPSGTLFSTSESDEELLYDFPSVLLNLPSQMPELVGEDGETFHLQAIQKRTGLAVLRDVPLPITVLALLITSLMSFWLSRSITRPIIELQRTTESLSSGKLDERASHKASSRSDELGKLARSLNMMADQLSALIKGQQQLLRDVSHEVRSPLTRIRLASALLNQRDPAAVEATTRIDLEITRLDELIEKILDVSRLESGSVSLKLESIDLRGIVERVLADGAFEATQLGKRLSFELSAHPLSVIADRYWIQSAIENVLRNALKHTTSGAAVEAVLDQIDGFARLRIRDSGAGLPEPELTRIFEPFYRSSSVRSERTDSSTGLGLAIAAQVMRGHGGIIEARNLARTDSSDLGFEVSLRWPLAMTAATDDRTAGEPGARDLHFRE